MPSWLRAERGLRWALCGLVVIVRTGCAAAQPAPARAQAAPVEGPSDPGELEAIPTVTAIEYVVGGVLAVTAVMLWRNPPDQDSVSGPVLFDETARKGLRLGSGNARQVADDVSDFLLWSLMTYPFIDILLAATVLDRERSLPADVAIETVLVLTAAATVTFVSKNAVARARPFVPDCRKNPGYASECRTHVPAASFMSGHTALSFAAAVMSCVHHHELELYRSRGADVAACAAPLALASVVGLLRIMSDQHYASDVVAGTVIGSASALGLGLFLHY